MYDIKTQQFDQIITNNNNNSKNSNNECSSSSSYNNNSEVNITDKSEGSFAPHCTSSAYSTCSVIKLSACPSAERNPADTTHMTLLTLRRRRWWLQRHACLLSIVLAFVFGLALGVFMPMFGWSNILSMPSLAEPVQTLPLPLAPADTLLPQLASLTLNRTTQPSSTKVVKARPPSDFPTIYELRGAEVSPPAPDNSPFSVAFIKEANVAQLKRKIVKPSLLSEEVNFVPLTTKGATRRLVNSRSNGIIKSDIYWGDQVESALPRGFTSEDTQSWNRYVSTRGVVEHLETGCGRMQNRLVIFADGTRACARYRQNTDQIQGELFSFYLGQLLNLTNLAPSAAAVIDLNSRTWASALGDITQAQWKQQRPVVLTRWLPELEPAGIPQPFQPMERHLNKYDVWNITQASNAKKPQKGLLKRLGSSSTTEPLETTSTSLSSTLVMQRLIELAQWSDLIVFDYLIANLDRVVNNLYNFQWNADIMAAPAHNLARQTHSQLLVFLDNESGLLHGYRLLKKYEAYHGLLLDNLCVFRQPTIEALRQLRDYGTGRRLRELFESTTTAEVRDVLPSLPDKSIKILVDRIDRVLGQVQKCRDLLADR